MVTRVNSKSTIVDSDGDSVDVIAANGYNGVVTVSPGHVSTGNSSTTPLGIGETFTGDAEDILDYGGIGVMVYSDVASATNGLVVKYSFDAIIWHDGEAYTIPAGTVKFFTPPKQAKYMMVSYTNGSSAQSTFHLHTFLSGTTFKWSSHNINASLNDDDDAELVASVLKLRTAQDTYVSGAATGSGNFKISVEEFDDAVSIVLTDYTDNLNDESVLQTASAMFGRASDTLVAPIKIDASTFDAQVIEHEHAEIHGGDHYNYCDYALNQASGITIEFIITTPDTTKWTHFTFEVSSSAGATLELYEGASGISGGTAITPRNNNRNSANVSTVTLIKDPSSISNDGVRAAGFLAGGDRVAGLVGRGREKILKQNTTYLARITSLAVSNDISWCAEWYEHTDKA